MGSLLDFARAAIVPATAARAGFVSGEREKNDDEQKRRDRTAALQRQSRLDVIQEALRKSEQEKNDAEADWYKKRPTELNAAPTTKDTDEGIKQWDPATKTWKVTGMRAPVPASERPKVVAAREGRERRAEQNQQLGGVNKQIDDTRADIKEAQNDITVDDPTPRVTALRTRLDSLKGVSDSLNTVIKGGAVAPKSTPALPLTPAAPSHDAQAEKRADWDRAAKALRAQKKDPTTVLGPRP